MSKGRLEAFSDGVIAIIITIMVLELAVPEEGELSALVPLIPIFLSYVLSFLYVGIYWNNHHHLLMTVKQVNGRILWANLHLLFWLSLTPFATAWMGENDFAMWPVVLYAFVLFCAGLAYWILAQVILASEGRDSPLAAAIGRDTKGIISMVIYLVAMGVAFANSLVAFGLLIVVALMWVVPDTRIEKRLAREKA